MVVSLALGGPAKKKKKWGGGKGQVETEKSS